MVEKAEILARASALKGHVWVMEPEEEEMRWTGKAYGATFELTKPEGVIFESVGDTSHLVLTLKGKVNGKQRLRSDFTQVLGEPKAEVQARRFRSPQMLLWDTTKTPQSEQPK